MDYTNNMFFCRLTVSGSPSSTPSFSIENNQRSGASFDFHRRTLRSMQRDKVTVRYVIQETWAWEYEINMNMVKREQKLVTTQEERLNGRIVIMKAIAGVILVIFEI